MGGYNVQAKPTEYKGVMYASIYESKFAVLLDKMKINFIPHCWVVVDIEGEERWREIDFFCYPRPIRPIFCDQFFFGFELKAKLQMSDYIRMKSLKDSGVPTFIVLPELLYFWEECYQTTGTFLTHKLLAIKKKKGADASNGNVL